MPLSVFNPPINIPASATIKQKRWLLDKMRAALTAEYNYYGALYLAGGLSIAQRDQYDDSYDAAHKAIKAIERAL